MIHLKPTVAIAIPGGEWKGGAEQLLANLLIANRRTTNVNYQLMFCRPGPLRDLALGLEYPVKLKSLRMDSIGDVPSFLMSVFQIHRFIQESGADVLVSWFPVVHPYASFAARVSRIKEFWWQHQVPEGTRYDRILARFPTNGIICPSLSAKQALQRITPGASIHVVYPSVDFNRFDPASLPSVHATRLALGLPLDGPLIGTVARLERAKGLDILVEAAVRVCSTRPDCHFVIVGGEDKEPGYELSLRRRIRELGLDGRVFLVGHQTNVHIWMQAMDMVILPSITAESFGMVIVEAMSLGKPVIATRVGGPEEIISDKVNGWLVSPNDALALAQSILIAIQNPIPEDFSSAAKQTAERFSSDVFARRFAETIGAGES